MSFDEDFSVLDAEHKEKSYRGLARHYAKTGNSWLAVHAQATADLATLTVALGRPFDFSAAADAMASEGIYLLGDGADAKYAVEQFRIFLAERLSDEEREAWRTRLCALGYLNDLPTLTPEPLKAAVAARFNQLTPADFIESKMADALTRMNEVSELLAEGKEWDAVEACYESDLNVFEAWLVNRSLYVGDEDFIQTEMRWALAVAVLENLSSLPSQFAEASSVVRSRLAWVVGPTDAEDLAEQFIPTPA